MAARGPIAVIALTGGVASGKTLVSDTMATRGVPVVDTDLLAREVVAAGSPTLAAIAERFGPELIGADGTLNRRAMRQRILDDPGARLDLQALTHPAIRELARLRLSALTSAWALLVVPLLAESTDYHFVSRVLVVVADPTTRVKRLMQRDGVSLDAAERLMAAQTDDAHRLRMANDVLVNDSLAAELIEKVARLTDFYDSLYGRFRS